MGRNAGRLANAGRGEGLGKKTAFPGLDSTHRSRAVGNGPLRRKEFACDAAKAVTGWVMCQRRASHTAEIFLGAKPARPRPVAEERCWRKQSPMRILPPMHPGALSHSTAPETS